MKYAFSTLGCPQWSKEQVVDAAIKLGYSAIEWRLLDGEVIDPVSHADKVREAVAYAREHGIETCTFDTSCAFNFPEAEKREKHITDLKNWIKLAQETNVATLRVFGGSGSGEDLEAENQVVAAALREVAPLAEQAGVTIVLETHDGFASARRTAQVLQAVNSPAVAALWDTHHPYRMGESAEEVWEVLQPRIAHAHVKDAVRKDDGNWQLVLAGAGEVPIKEQLRILKQNNYQGYISVEWEKKWHPEIEEPEVAFPQHITWLKETEAAL